MPLSLAESQAVNEIAQLLHDFLPGTPHPYADHSISFPGVAHSLGLSHLWRGGSKLPALATLLERTLETRRELFCDLILGIVRKGLTYRGNKGNPVTREEIRTLNDLVARVQFKIPDLWDPAFLNSLPSDQMGEKQQPASLTGVDELKDKLLELSTLEPRPRGFAFERFLNETFSAYGLEPRGAFRLVGERMVASKLGWTRTCWRPSGTTSRLGRPIS